MPDEPGTVWDRPERGARGPAPVRTRAQITAVAVALADAEGLAAVSMRRVAAELGTGPASLYRYVGGRDDLVDLMIDAVAGEIDLSGPLAGDPVEDLAVLAMHTKDAQLRHPWMLDVPPEPERLGPCAIDYLEHGLRALEPAESMTGQAKMETIAVMNGLASLFARTELQERSSPTERQAAYAAHLTQVVAEGRHPLLAGLVARQVPGPHEDHQALFERLIRRVLAGLIG
ncbi:TetR/AcrR family transcriptional regulator C-terminal domain-containing protein [Actinomadura vinacea]|uniref:TetR/AcrR family transcriptional regulator C-terminal domain-containing protein n=1 Tax=Actinomadura vinacea TaxID=115336 RepID=A0ABN3IEF3_9ACTN